VARVLDEDPLGILNALQTRPFGVVFVLFFVADVVIDEGGESARESKRAGYVTQATSAC
jgi:hypothetical protein